MKNIYIKRGTSVNRMKMTSHDYGTLQSRSDDELDESDEIYDYNDMLAVTVWGKQLKAAEIA